MQKLVNAAKFEHLLLNHIYNTSFFSPEQLHEIEIKHDYSPLLSAFVSFRSQHCNKSELMIEKLPLIEEIIKVSNFVSDSQNFSCYDQIQKLNGLLEENPSFSFILQEKSAEFSFLDVIVFSSLHNCKLWSKLYRPGAKNAPLEQNFKNNPLYRLFLWFSSFETAFTDLIKYRFNPSLLDPKRQKQQEKNSKTKKRNPEFIKAVKDQDYDRILGFLKEGVDLKVVDPENGNSAAHIACLSGELKLCKILDGHGIDWEAENLENITPVFNALESANMDLIVYLCEEKKVNIEHRDFQNRSPFYHACCFGNMEVIDYLYRKCHCDPNTKSTKNRTALSKTCFLAKHEVVKFLLSLPAPHTPILDEIDDKGRTALHNACWGPKGGKDGKFLNGVLIEDSPKSTELLIEKGATVDFTDFDGNTPFIISAASEGIESMRILYKNGANINWKNKKGETAIFFSCKFGHLKSLKVLLEEMKCEMLGITDDGMSNLTGCLMFDQPDTFDYLKEKEWGVKKIEEYRQDFTYLFFNKTDKLAFEALSRLISFFRDKGIKLSFLDFYLDKLAGLKQKEIFAMVLEFFLPNMQLHQKKALFYRIIEEDKLSNLQIFQKSDPSFFQEFIPDCASVILLFKKRQISLDLLGNLIFDTNFDVFSAPGFLHFIVEKRKISLVIALRKLFTSESSSKWNNKFIKELLEQPPELKKLQIVEFMIKVDPETETNCFEYAKLKKYFDIEKVLKELADIFFKSSDFQEVEHYHIPFRVLKDSKIEVIPCHSFKEILENTNKILMDSKDQSAFQYQINHNEEITFVHSLLMNPSCFDKKQPYFFIKTEDELKAMAEEIKNYCILGIDLEYLQGSESFTTEEANVSNEEEEDSQRKSGFVCTLQISTIKKDYIIDALLLRYQISKYLKPLFEDFSKIKLFHGSDMDIQWLKVDFDINLMNLFDTAKGFRLLSASKDAISLTKLTEKYLDTKLDKSLQVSFWGLRPLPKIMLEYARLDSRVLLGLFSCILNDLREKGLEKQMAIHCNRMCWEKTEKIKMKRLNYELIEQNKK